MELGGLSKPTAVLLLSCYVCRQDIIRPLVAIEIPLQLRAFVYGDREAWLNFANCYIYDVHEGGIDSTVFLFRDQIWFNFQWSRVLTEWRLLVWRQSHVNSWGAMKWCVLSKGWGACERAYGSLICINGGGIFLPSSVTTCFSWSATLHTVCSLPFTGKANWNVL
jgi:hypothetical protein